MRQTLSSQTKLCQIIKRFVVNNVPRKASLVVTLSVLILEGVTKPAPTKRHIVTQKPFLAYATYAVGNTA